MLISELPAGSQVTITASSDERKATLESEILSLSDKDAKFLTALLSKTTFRSCAAVSRIASGNQTVNFSAPNIQCDCISIYENNPYLWENVKIVVFTLPEAGQQHLIFSSTDARAFNRRKDFRQWVGVDCKVTYGSPAVTKQGTVKDISVTGIGLFVSPDCNVELKKRIRVDLLEPKTNSDGEKVIASYTVYAIPVRIVSVNQRTNLIGCRLADAGKDYVQFLYRKQREAMQHDKGMDL